MENKANLVTPYLGGKTNIPQNDRIVDIVGTGGDGAHTINISTAASILVAACGSRVGKMGNRSVSSKCGSADVLEAAGIYLEMTPQQLAKSIEEVGIAFMYAPVIHPSMSRVAPVRKALGVRTVFNIVGPLINAAGAKYTVIGVFKKELLDLMAESLIERQHIEKALIVHGSGLDELSCLGPSDIIKIEKKAHKIEGNKTEYYYTKEEFTLEPLEYGISRCNLEDLKGGDPKENLALLWDVLAPGGPTTRNAKRDTVVLNAASALFAIGRVDSIDEGVTLAYKVLEEGKAEEKLKQWALYSTKIRSTINTKNEL